MLHDSLLSGTDPLRSGDRRRSTRSAVRAELVVRWHHDPDTPIRYPVLDVGEGGCRIHTATPLLKGMSGTAVKLLPKGTRLNRMCTVSWVRSLEESRVFEIGLRFTP